MRALLLSAGLGTRLKPLTDTLPKCLVPIGGQPLLGIWLERLTRAGIDRLLVNTHYFAEMVEAYVRSSPYASQVKLVNEPVLLGTAGTLLANLDFFDGRDGMLIHADNFCPTDLAAFVRAHLSRPAECLMTMMTFKTQNPGSCGIVEIDARGVVMNFHEKVQNPPGNLANGAVYILSTAMLETLGKEFTNARDFSTEVLSKFLCRIYTYETPDTFLDIGTPETYKLANLLAERQ